MLRISESTPRALQSLGTSTIDFRSGPKYPIDARYPDTNLPSDFFSTHLRGPHKLNDLLGLDADPLSGLARAFFHAGAKTLLMSHWAVDSAATALLISRTFEIMAREHAVAPIEALRQSMLDMIRDPALAHPAKWAPFVMIGESKRDGGRHTVH